MLTAISALVMRPPSRRSSRGGVHGLAAGFGIGRDSSQPEAHRDCPLSPPSGTSCCEPLDPSHFRSWWSAFVAEKVGLGTVATYVRTIPMAWLHFTILLPASGSEACPRFLGKRVGIDRRITKGFRSSGNCSVQHGVGVRRAQRAGPHYFECFAVIEQAGDGSAGDGNTNELRAIRHAYAEFPFGGWQVVAMMQSDERASLSKGHRHQLEALIFGDLIGNHTPPFLELHPRCAGRKFPTPFDPPRDNGTT